MAYDTQSAFAGFRYSDPRSNIDTTGIVKGGQLLAEALKSGRQKELENAKFALEQKQAQRAEDLFNRQTDEYNREVTGRQAMQDYASQPIDTARMLASQRGLADEALLADANARNAKWEQSLKANNITQEQVNKGQVSPEIMSKLYDPALDAQKSAEVSKMYSTMSPFREDVESTIEKDLIAKQVDPLKAKQYAQMEGAKYQSIPEYQTMLNTQAEKATTNAKELFKDTLELEKFKREAYKDELDKYKTKMETLYKGLGTSGGSSTGGAAGGGLLGGQDKSKAYEKAYTKAGNEDELVKRLDAAFTQYGAKAVNNALAASGIDEPVRWLELDIGKRDVALDRFDKALANEKPISAVQSQFGSGIPEAPTYNLPGAAKVYTPESARAMAQMSGRDRMNEILGVNTVAPVAAQGQTTNTGKDIAGSNIKSMVVDKYGEGNFNKATYDKNLSTVESGGNYNAYNASSKAFGKYQFVPSTINSLIKDEGNKHTMEEVKKSPKLQDYYYNKLTNENIGTLQSKGVPVNNFTVYMAHNLGPSQTANFFSNEPLTDATKKAIQAQGVEPTREAYVNRFMNKFEGVATPEEKRPTVQTKDITKMTDAERKAYADSVFGPTQESPIKDLFSGGKSTEIKKELDSLQKDNSPQAQDRKLLLNDQYQVAKENEDAIKNKSVYEEVKSKFIQNNGGLMDSNLAIMDIMKKTGVRYKEAERKYYALVEEAKKTKAYKDTLLDNLVP